MLDLIPAFPNALATVWTVLAVILALEWCAYWWWFHEGEVGRRRRVALLAMLAIGVGAGWQPIAREILQRTRCYVTDFGAVPNDGLDDSAAIIAGIRSAIQNKTYHLHFPGGEWDVDTDNVLHPATADQAPGYGINFTGASQNYSQIVLHRESGTPRWLYDSDENPGWNRVQFSHLWFRSDMPNYAAAGYDPTFAADVNGFRIWGSLATAAVDKGFVYQFCRFNGLGTPFKFSGTAVTDGCHGYSNWVHNCGPIEMENDQCLAFKWYASRFWYPRDLFWIRNTTGEGSQGKGGAGDILLSGCDLIHEGYGHKTVSGCANNGSGLIRITSTAHGFTTGDYVTLTSVGGVSNANSRYQITRITDNTFDLDGSTFAGTYTSGGLAYAAETDDVSYTVRVDDGAAFARNFTIRDSRWELRLTYLSRIFHKRGESSFTFTNELLLDGCDFSANHGGESGATGREYFSMGGQTFVHLRDCHCNERMGAGFYDVTNNNITSLQYQPLLVMDDCALGPTFVANLNTRITRDTGSSNPGGYGRVISRGGRALTSVNLADNYSFDFDFGKGRGGRGEPARRMFVVQLKADHQAWPILSSGVGSSERTVTLPPGTRIIAAGFSKPAASSGATAVRYAIGKGDKSVIFARSNPYRVDGLHQAYADRGTSPHVLPYTVGSSPETFRLWMTDHAESSVTATAGEAYLVCE
jgi:hypothetical protein